MPENIETRIFHPEDLDAAASVIIEIVEMREPATAPICDRQNQRINVVVQRFDDACATFDKFTATDEIGRHNQQVLTDSLGELQPKDRRLWQQFKVISQVRKRLRTVRSRQPAEQRRIAAYLTRMAEGFRLKQLPLMMPSASPPQVELTNAAD